MLLNFFRRLIRNRNRLIFRYRARVSRNDSQNASLPGPESLGL